MWAMSKGPHFVNGEFIEDESGRLTGMPNCEKILVEH